jgi:transmembrane sensor
MSEHIEKLIIKALQGNILPEEHYELECWIAEDEQNKKAYDEFAFTWRKSVEGTKPPAVDSDAEWIRLKTITESPTIYKEKSVVLRWTLRAAAAIAFIVISTYLITTTISKNELITFRSTTDTLSVRLPDGSLITLNHNAQISYHEDFENNRSIDLAGEAFFDVAKDEEHPFVIHTSAAMIRVVGTSFNVDAGKRNETLLSVMTGVVECRVIDQENAVSFAAGESGVISADKNTIEKAHEINADSWRTKLLTFKDTPLAEVVNSVDKYFDQDFLIDENLTDCKVTAEFKDPTLDEVVATITEMLSLTVERRNKHYLLHGEGCRSE